MRYIIKRSLLLVAISVLGLNLSFGQEKEGEKMKAHHTEFWDPEVEVVDPGSSTVDAPADAITLFDGKESTFEKEWIGSKDDKSWSVSKGAMTVVKGAGAISTVREFGDIQLHVEWRSPKKVVGDGQGRGNSGIFLQKVYEVQVLDNYNNRTYRNGQAGSVYKQHAPLVNACRKPGEWQTYDIIYTAPRFNDNGSLHSPATVTVLHNGVLVQNHSTLLGPTEYVGIPKYKAHGKAPIMLQDHGNPVSYRNIWVRELN